MTENRQLKTLSLTDFPTPPIVVGRVRVPKHFDAHSAAARRNLASAFLTRLAEVDLPDPRRTPRPDDELIAEVESVRLAVRAHPCHRCPDREDHVRLTEQAMRLERETSLARERAHERSNTIATAFDRVCGVLQALGYLDDEGLAVSDSGRVLARIYGEAKTLMGGLVFMFAGIVTQGMAPNWQIAVVGFALVCIGQSICFPNISALFSRAAPPDRQGEMLGLNMSGMALARIGGPVAAGQLFSAVSPGAPFAFSALLILPAFWFAMQVIRRVPRLA